MAVDCLICLTKQVNFRSSCLKHWEIKLKIKSIVRKKKTQGKSSGKLHFALHPSKELKNSVCTPGQCMVDTGTDRTEDRLQSRAIIGDLSAHCSQSKKFYQFNAQAAFIIPQTGGSAFSRTSMGCVSVREGGGGARA